MNQASCDRVLHRFSHPAFGPLSVSFMSCTCSNPCIYYMYIYIYICMYVYICIYIYISPTIWGLSQNLGLQMGGCPETECSLVIHMSVVYGLLPRRLQISHNSKTLWVRILCPVSMVIGVLWPPGRFAFEPEIAFGHPLSTVPDVSHGTKTKKKRREDSQWRDDRSP